MLYFLAVGGIGLVCAMALRWPVMAGLAILVAIACCFVEIRAGVGVLEAAGLSMITFVVMQSCYVLGGFLLTLRLRQILTDKNAQTRKEMQ